jgi:hypothetical protein
VTHTTCAGEHVTTLFIKKEKIVLACSLQTGIFIPNITFIGFVNNGSADMNPLLNLFRQTIFPYIKIYFYIFKPLYQQKK